jgi:hypothetical protein
MKSARFALPTLALALALGSGCAHELVYRPAVLGATGGPAVRYPVPPEAPRGDVYVTSFGFSDLEVGPGGQHASLLHARLAVTNGGPGPWALDGRQQEVLVAGQPPLVPAFINSDAGVGPLYPIPPGQTRVLDLFYFVPPPLDRIDALPSFALAWRVLAGIEPVAQRTPFQRVIEDQGAYGSYPPYVGVGLGVGVGWWYGPFYAYHYPPVIRGYYYPPVHGRATGAWRGAPPRATGAWRASPGGGGWRGAPARGGWRH